MFPSRSNTHESYLPLTTSMEIKIRTEVSFNKKNQLITLNHQEEITLKKLSILIGADFSWHNSFKG
jgi:hypothetical protein